MEKDNKQLLIRDICAQLPYGVYVKFKQYNEPLYLSVEDKLAIYNGGELINDLQYLYLRPMSNMTEEERNEISKKLNYEFYVDDEGALCAEDDRHRVRVDLIEIYIEWLNAHHFDYRGLIPIGLGIDCTGLNIYENEKSI